MDSVRVEQGDDSFSLALKCRLKTHANEDYFQHLVRSGVV